MSKAISFTEFIKCTPLYLKISLSMNNSVAQLQEKELTYIISRNSNVR